MIRQASRLNIDVVAEGVENIEELSALNDICNNVSPRSISMPTKIQMAIQGYYFSKPKAFEEIAHLGPNEYTDKALIAKD